MCDLEHLPHVLADVLGGEVAGEGHRLLVELHDGVCEDVMDSLEDDGLQRSVDLGPILHHGEDGLQSVELTHDGDGLLVPSICTLEDLY